MNEVDSLHLTISKLTNELCKLTGEISNLTTEISTLKSEINELKIANDNLLEENKYLKKQLFGSKKETTPATEEEQIVAVFNEAEITADPKAREEEEEIVVSSHSRKPKRTKEEIFGALPIEKEVIAADDKCPKCNGDTVVIGEEYIREEIVYVPAKLFRRQYYREVRKCKSCGTTDDQPIDTIYKAEAPKPVFPRSYCSPELLANIIVEKYGKQVPLERLSKDFMYYGAEISTATMSNWVIEGANIYLKPIYNQLHERLLSSLVIHADETPVQVHYDGIKKDDKNKKSTNVKRMWVYASGKYEKETIVLYDYKPDRKGINAKEFLKGFSGYLVTDGFAGYNKVENVTRCSCQVHARRKFYDAIPSNKDLLKDSYALKAVTYFDKISKLEQQFADLSAEERYKQRQEHTKPILDAFYVWLEGFEAVKGSKLATAVQYALNEKNRLYAFLENGNIPTGNNLAERAIKPFVLGRKAWLFCTSYKGADASAICYSIVQTALINGINPREYIAKLIKGETDLLPLKGIYTNQN